MAESLITVIEKEKLPQNMVQNLKESFEQYFDMANKIVIQAKKINITSYEQKDDMRIAREMRLKLKHIRTSVEQTRKQLKADIVRKGRAIDGIANVIKYLIVPVEEYLEKQEKYIEIEEEKKKQKLLQERTEAVVKYDGDPALYNLLAMDEDTFNNLISTLKKEKEKEEAEAKALAEEQERIRKEKERQEEMERIRKENERLKKEREEKERLEAKLKAEHEAKLKKEREEKERLEAKKRAPDKEKLALWVKELSNIDAPEVESNKAKAIVKDATDKIASLVSHIKKQIVDL